MSRSFTLLSGRSAQPRERSDRRRSLRRIGAAGLSVLLLTGIGAVGNLGIASAATEVTAAELEPGLDTAPSQLVFSAVAGGECEAEQSVSIVTWDTPEQDWTASSDASWLSLSETSGSTPAQPTATADCSQLAEGTHQSTLTITGEDGEQEIPVQAVINPAGSVRLATWKDGHAGAFSSSTDDGRNSGYTEFLATGTAGTFVMNDTEPPADYPELHEAGMEIGSHLVSHYCSVVSPAVLTDEIVDNLEGVVMATGSYEKVTSLVWPCGFRDTEYGVIAADYFTSGRGYHINELEDSTPWDFMNLKSYNSHEHEPIPPADLKSIVDDAETQGKWANLVLHDFTNDDGAIEYATTRDVWVAPIGKVITYILQRDRTVIEDVSVSSSAVTFDFHRLGLPTSPVRDFEDTIEESDQITFEYDLDPGTYVQDVSVSNAQVPFDIVEDSGTRTLRFSASVTASEQTASITLSASQPPAIDVDTSVLRFSGETGENIDGQQVSVDNAGGGSLVWQAAADSDSAAWLSVSPSSGTGSSTFAVQVDTASLEPGVHRGSVIVSSSADANTARIPVTLRLNSQGGQSFVFDYTSRAEFADDGWDFLARTASGSPRDTEQTSGATVSYTARGLRVPADTGDLWEGSNDTRNSVFRDLPAGWTSAQVKLLFAPHQNYQHAGLLVYGSDDDYVEVTRAFNSYTGGNGVAFISESGGTVASSTTTATAATALVLRLDRDPATDVVSGSYSTDAGATWTAVGSDTRDIEDPRLGIVVAASPNGFPSATVLEAHVETGTGGSTPTEPSSPPTTEPTSEPTEEPTSEPTTEPTSEPTEEPEPGTQTYLFDYASRSALVGDGWDFLARTPQGSPRDTEQISGATVTYTAGGLRIPADQGDLWESANDTRNTVFRDLPEDWTRAQLRLSFAPQQDYQHAGIVVYGHDDDYIELTRAYNSWVGGNGIAFIDEEGGAADDSQRLTETATDLILRLDRDTATGEITGSYSADDGANWTHVGSSSREIQNPRIAINVAGSTGGLPEATIHSLALTTESEE